MADEVTQVLFENPLNEERYETQQEYVQALLDSYAKIKKEMWNWQQDEAKVLAVLGDLANAIAPTVQKGTIRVNGVTHVAKLEKSLNPQYARAKGEEHPLRRLLQEYPQVGDLIRVDYEESGSKIQQLLDRLAAGQLLPDDSQELAVALASVRSTKPAKLKVVIEERTDVESEG